MIPEMMELKKWKKSSRGEREFGWANKSKNFVSDGEEGKIEWIGGWEGRN